MKIKDAIAAGHTEFVAVCHSLRSRKTGLSACFKVTVIDRAPDEDDVFYNQTKSILYNFIEDIGDDQMLLYQAGMNYEMTSRGQEWEVEVLSDKPVEVA